MILEIYLKTSKFLQRFRSISFMGLYCWQVNAWIFVCCQIGNKPLSNLLMTKFSDIHISLCVDLNRFVWPQLTPPSLFKAKYLMRTLPCKHKLLHVLSAFIHYWVRRLTYSSLNRERPKDYVLKWPYWCEIWNPMLLSRLSNSRVCVRGLKTCGFL